MKKFIIAIIASAFLPNAKAYDVLNLYDLGNSTTSVDSIIPIRTVSEVSDGIVVDYTINGLIVQDDEIYANSKLLKLYGFGLNETPAEPSYPIRVDNVQLDRNGVGYSVSLIDSSYIDIDMKLGPARPALSDLDYGYYSSDNVPAIVSYASFYPKSVIEQLPIQYYRGIPIANIAVKPIKYDAKNEKVRVFTHLSYKITYNLNGNQYQPLLQNPIEISTDDCFFKNTVINMNEPEIISSNDVVDDTKDYLIISVPAYQSAVNEFAEWKRMLGYRTHVVIDSVWTPSSIFNLVKQTYLSSGINLYYLLIIGGHNDVPGYMKSYSSYGSYPTDFYYSCLDGSSIGTDNTPDIRIGRLPARSLGDVQNMIYKIITYEKIPVEDTDFYNHGLNCAMFQDSNYDGYADRRFAQTAEEIKNYLDNLGYNITRVYNKTTDSTPLYWNNGQYSFGEELPSELRPPLFTWDGHGSDIVNEINNGAFYVLHRDHGTETRWDTPYFSSSDINQLNNENKYPVVFSLNCSTGKFNYSQDCLCEMFLHKQRRGSVACIGATNTSFSGYNDAFAEGMFDAIWPSPGLVPTFRDITPNITPLSHPIYELGAIMQQGKKRIEETYYSNQTYSYTKEIFHLFGDPSMQIYTQQPTAFEGVTINRGANTIDVCLGCDTAKIAFYNPATNEVNTYIGNSISYSCSSPDDVIVCISDHNKVPYINYSKIYIQNETISDVRYYNATSIDIGTNVTSSKPQGDVVFESGRIDMKARQVRIFPKTTIEKGALVNIKTH